ncbi:hypothetical protein KSD_95580 [Ktedonobacter sp. SOSP1-85]|nr:hypothetical protein KSD_95580 [Ktedonobacter sp. SOSP1-85]
MQDGVVSLKGWVDSYAQKIAAEDAARRVRGVKDVNNELEVRLPETATRNDDDLVKALINTLSLDPAIPVDRLEITVSKGKAEYPFQRLEAEWVIILCEYKAENAGTVQVLKVDPKYTSQICSGCGTVVKKELSERWHSCECGCELDQDHNAAINIKCRWLGRSLQDAQAS